MMIDNLVTIIGYKNLSDTKNNTPEPPTVDGDIFTIKQKNLQQDVEDCRCDENEESGKSNNSTIRWENLVFIWLPGVTAVIVMMVTLFMAVQDKEYRTMLNLQNVESLKMRETALEKSHRFFFMSIIWTIIGLFIATLEMCGMSNYKDYKLWTTLVSAFLFILGGMFCFCGIFQMTQLYKADTTFVPNSWILSMAWVAYIICMLTAFCETCINVKYRTTKS